MRGGVARYSRFGHELNMLAVRGLGDDFPLSLSLCMEDERQFLTNGLNPIDFFVEPGTYVKIRELAAHYTLDRQQLKKIGLGRLENVRLGVIGRNLFTFTKYSGYDPEVAGLDGDPYQFRMDWFQYPHFRTFTGVVEIAF